MSNAFDINLDHDGIPIDCNFLDSISEDDVKWVSVNGIALFGNVLCGKCLKMLLICPVT